MRIMSLVLVETTVCLTTSHVLDLRLLSLNVLLISTLPVYHGVVYLILVLDASVRMLDIITKLYQSFYSIDPVVCTNGDVRLADGIIDNEGRVEVCVNGVWGVVCDQGWDKTDAHVVCTQLGHPELGIYANIKLRFLK